MLLQLIPALGIGGRNVFWNGSAEVAFAKYTLKWGILQELVKLPKSSIFLLSYSAAYFLGVCRV